MIVEGNFQVPHRQSSGFVASVPYSVAVCEPSDQSVLGSEPDGPSCPPPSEDHGGPVEAVPLPLVLEPLHQSEEPVLCHDIIITGFLAWYNSV